MLVWNFFFVRNKFWVQKDFGPKKILCKKNLGPKKNVGPKKYSMISKVVSNLNTALQELELMLQIILYKVRIKCKSKCNIKRRQYYAATLQHFTWSLNLAFLFLPQLTERRLTWVPKYSVKLPLKLQYKFQLCMTLTLFLVIQQNKISGRINQKCEYLKIFQDYFAGWDGKLPSIKQ